MRPILVLTGAVVIWSAVSVPVRGQPRTVSPQLSVLRDLAADLRRRNQLDRRALERLAQTGGLPLRQTLSDGRVMELQRLARGRPVYTITTNLNAARTVSADRVWPGGDLGLGLSGLGITVGQWDEGPVLPTHQELAGRVTLMEDATIASNHATHVAGTILAYGIMDTARGMAREAQLQSYDWIDDSAEMATAAADGLALSNHSYSFVAGWIEGFNPDEPNDWYWFGDPGIDDMEDWKFGFYLQESADWDQITVNAPNYLIVTSAGNDRADTGPALDETHWVWNASDSLWVPSNAIRDPDGDFDSLPGGMGAAKNVLVIGAVEDIPAGYGDPSDVVMTPFSSWGPTDDGRIKPDLVANGVALTSTLASGTAAYGSLSGTSMAAPSVTGSVALLQQHYGQTHGGDFPLAATLRALLIHTADEAGADPGPDYVFGWGLVNIATAAEVILEDSLAGGTIRELALFDGGITTIEVTSDGVEPLKVTLAWNDPPGAVLEPQLNPETAMLVNDLDLRVTRESDGQVSYPWRLDVTQPQLAAEQGDNSVDNIEQVLISLPAPGNYAVTVTHKGLLLAGIQNFSLVITGGTFAVLPAVLVWDGDSTGVDYSGAFIRDILNEAGQVDVVYTSTFPSSMTGFDAVFLSFGNSGGGQDHTFFDTSMAYVVQTYLEGSGGLYLEGGDALGQAGFNQGANDSLHHLLGLAAVSDGVFSHT
ncbi:MAG: S8 family serine peptidase, partial [Candidatus Marinimicrobia bacterium]|nr:S8 family serine peptidase [Candidatus Neomarinimicrobiota bacterium]